MWQMAALYEINQAVMDCIDSETGEILDERRLHSLQMERRQKIRNIACWIKNLRADVQAYEAEEKTFLRRKTAAKNQAERLQGYLADCLRGEKISDKEFAISWRRSQKVQIINESAIPSEYYIPVPAKLDRAGLKDALKQGNFLPGAELIECNNIQIK